MALPFINEDVKSGNYKSLQFMPSILKGYQGMKAESIAGFKNNDYVKWLNDNSNSINKIKEMMEVK